MREEDVNQVTGSRVDFCGQQWYSIFAQEARTRSAERTEVHLTTHRFHEQTFGLKDADTQAY